jgi:hypothetical protein
MAKANTQIQFVEEQRINSSDAGIGVPLEMGLLAVCFGE